MKIQIKNLGVLKQAEFTLGDLTILCGGNNTGKTYATYALFGFLQIGKEMLSIKIHDDKIQQLLADGVTHIDVSEYAAQTGQIFAAGCQAYTKQLPKIFATSKERFTETEFQVIMDTKDIQIKVGYDRKLRTFDTDTEFFSISKTEDCTDLVITLLIEKEERKVSTDVITYYIANSLKDIIWATLLPRPFIASAERTGAVVFRKELNFARSRLLDTLIRTDNEVNPMELLFKNYQDYALPVKTNVDFTRQLEGIIRQSSFLAEKHPEVLDHFTDMIGGKYIVTSNDELYYVPTGKEIKLTMDESSSAVRSLLDLGFYLRHVAQPGDLLMIDEPELNLHPENQRRVARLLARLVNLGIKVFITTHSDYIVKELNTLIMLNHDKPHLKRIAEIEGYQPEELISSDKVKVYIAEEALVRLEGKQEQTKCQTLTPANIYPELGIEVRSFDTTIGTMNRIQETIVWGGE